MTFDYLKSIVFWFLSHKKVLFLTFSKAFIAVFILGTTGVLQDVISGNYTTAKDALTALVVGSLAAGLHAVEVYFKSGNLPTAITTNLKARLGK